MAIQVIFPRDWKLLNKKGNNYYAVHDFSKRNAQEMTNCTITSMQTGMNEKLISFNFLYLQSVMWISSVYLNK